MLLEPTSVAFSSFPIELALLVLPPVAATTAEVEETDADADAEDEAAAAAAAAVAAAMRPPAVTPMTVVAAAGDCEGLG